MSKTSPSITSFEELASYSRALRLAEEIARCQLPEATYTQQAAPHRREYKLDFTNPPAVRPKNKRTRADLLARTVRASWF